MGERPDYIARQGQGYDLSLAGPFRNRSVNMQLHVLDAELGPLRRTLSHYLNAAAPRGVSYLPLGDRVVVTCLDVAEGRAGDETLGSSHEVEVALFIPALRCDPLPSAVVGFNPYLFVNHAWALVPGREIHGFRKDVAVSFSKTLDVDGPTWRHRARDVEHVEAWAMRRRARESRLERMTLIEIRHPPDSRPPSEGAASLISALIGSGSSDLLGKLPGLADELPRLGALTRLLEAAVRGRDVRVRSVLLRQFRDPRQSGKADVQEILEVESVATLTGAPTILRPSEIRLQHADSHPIATELGLDAGKWLRANLSMELNMDFVLGDAVA